MNENWKARAEAAESALAAIGKVADDLAAYDCTERPTPQGIDVPDDYEAGLHRAALMIRAALATPTTTERSEG